MFRILEVSDVDFHKPVAWHGSSLLGRDKEWFLRVAEKLVKLCEMTKREVILPYVISMVDDVNNYSVGTGNNRAKLEALNEFFSLIRIRLLSAGKVSDVERSAWFCDAMIKNAKDSAIYSLIGSTKFLKTLSKVARRCLVVRPDIGGFERNRVGRLILDIIQGWGEAFDEIVEYRERYPEFHACYARLRDKHKLVFSRPPYDPTRVPIFLLDRVSLPFIAQRRPSDAEERKETDLPSEIVRGRAERAQPGRGGDVMSRQMSQGGEYSLPSQPRLTRDGHPLSPQSPQKDLARDMLSFNFLEPDKVQSLTIFSQPPVTAPPLPSSQHSSQHHYQQQHPFWHSSTQQHLSTAPVVLAPKPWQPLQPPPPLPPSYPSYQTQSQSRPPTEAQDQDQARQLLAKQRLLHDEYLAGLSQSQSPASPATSPVDFGGWGTRGIGTFAPARDRPLPSPPSTGSLSLSGKCSTGNGGGGSGGGGGAGGLEELLWGAFDAARKESIAGKEQLPAVGAQTSDAALATPISHPTQIAPAPAPAPARVATGRVVPPQQQQAAAESCIKGDVDAVAATATATATVPASATNPRPKAQMGVGFTPIGQTADFSGISIKFVGGQRIVTSRPPAPARSQPATDEGK